MFISVICGIDQYVLHKVSDIYVYALLVSLAVQYPPKTVRHKILNYVAYKVYSIVSTYIIWCTVILLLNFYKDMQSFKLKIT